jgi:hypothetical protein
MLTGAAKEQTASRSPRIAALTPWADKPLRPAQTNQVAGQTHLKFFRFKSKAVL